MFARVFEFDPSTRKHCNCNLKKLSEEGGQTVVESGRGKWAARCAENDDSLLTPGTAVAAVRCALSAPLAGSGRRISPILQGCMRLQAHVDPPCVRVYSGV